MEDNNKRQYILQLCEDENGRDVLSKRLKELLENKEIYRMNLSSEITEALIKSTEGRKALEANFNSIIDLFEGDYYSDTIENEPDDIKYWTFICNLIKSEDGYEIICRNMQEVLNKFEPTEAMDFINQLRETEKNKFLKQNDYIIKAFEKGLLCKDTAGILLKNGLNDFIEVLFDELSEGKQIETVGKNETSYSQVFKTNGYIIKIGKEREKYEVPYHPKILQPLMKVRGIDRHGNSRYVFEVQNECNTKNVSEEDAQRLKEELLKVGIHCYDMGEENIGRTIVPNKRTLPIGTIDKPEINGSYDIGIKENVTEPGEVVIIDADCIDFKESTIEER